MKTSVCVFVLLACFSISESIARAVLFQKQQVKALDSTIEQFTLQDGTLLDGLSQLSSLSISGFHVGIEEIPRASINDPRDRSTHFSFVDKSKTLREILDQLCHYDSRYSWSADGDSINIFPKETSHDSSYLMSHALSEVTIKDVDDPGQALTPLATLFRDQQIGYIGIGGDIRYPSPWTSTFRNLSVRQFINRISEHMGDRTFWIWQGGRDERLFTFVKGEFHL